VAQGGAELIIQDVVIMVLCFCLGVAGMPDVFRKTKPSRLLCALYGTIVLGLAVTFATLKLWLSTGAEVFAATPFIIMFFQRRQ